MKWISVDDKLPRAYVEFVIVFTSTGNMGLALLENVGEVKWQFVPASSQVGYGYEIWEHAHRVDWNSPKDPYFDNLEGDERVTHWMPLPDPPNASYDHLPDIQLEIVDLKGGYYPPPWELSAENKDKTEGWCAFQDYHKDISDGEDK